MDELFEDLFRRWVRAFDELPLLESSRALVETKKYAKMYRYDLGEYTPKAFPAGGELSDEPPENGTDMYVYGFDQERRPVHAAFRHTWNKVRWEGFYSYSASRVEYVEFCLETGVPSTVKVMQLTNGKKTVLQYFHLNGGGSHVREGNREVYIEAIRNDGHSFVCTIEKYMYEGDRIAWAQCLDFLPGAGRSESVKTYIYGSDGELDEIRERYQSGGEQVTYAHVEEGMDITRLVDDLAAQMADAVVETLLKNHIEQPLATLELSYRSVSNYLPVLVPKTLADWEDIITAYGEETDFEVLFIPSYDTMFMVEAGALGRPLRQLEQLMEEKGDYDPAEKMLLKAAFLLTRGKLNGKIPVSDDFVAYAVDWEMDGPRFEEVLRDCGQREEVIKEWKKKGWI